MLLTEGGWEWGEGMDPSKMRQGDEEVRLVMDEEPGKGFLEEGLGYSRVGTGRASWLYSERQRPSSSSVLRFILLSYNAHGLQPSLLDSPQSLLLLLPPRSTAPLFPFRTKEDLLPSDDN